MKNKIINASEMKFSNRKRILEYLRIMPSSRAELARQTGLTRSAIGVIIDQLINEGILLPAESIIGNIGRRSVNLRFNPDKYCIAGVDIARDYCTIGLTDFAENIKHSAKILLNADDKMDKILDKIYRILINMLDYNHYNDRLLGIGITAPGPLDAQYGRILNPPDFPMAQYEDVTTYLKEKFQCPVLLENNACALALAELYHGIGNTYQSYVEVIVDTGIGAGIIIDGKPYKGIDGFACALGHITVDINGDQCSCGNYGCVELYASIPNILKYAKTKNAEYTTWESIVIKAKNGETEAYQIIQREVNLLSTAFTTIVNILDVDAIIIAGNIIFEDDLILPLLREKVNQQFFGKSKRKINLSSSMLGRQANLLSCINLIMEYYVQNISTFEGRER